MATSKRIPLIIYYIPLALTFCTAYFVQGQMNAAVPDIYSTFDSIVGERNMELYNGPIFREEFAPTEEAHGYYLSNSFVTGDVIYRGQPYYDQNLKYNIYVDELLITPKYNPNALLVQLVKNQVKEFVIQGDKFIRLDNQGAEGESLGYLEVLREYGESLLLKKHRKKRTESRKEQKVAIEYESLTRHFLLYNGKLFEVDRKGGWKDVFQDQKKELNQFYKTYRLTQKTDKDAFLVLLFDEFIKQNER